MKMPLAWHRDCLKCARLCVERAKAEAERAKATADRLAEEVKFYESQIAAAVADGKDGFDQDRYLKGKK